MIKGIATSFFDDKDNLERLGSTIPEDWIWIGIDGKHHNYKADHFLSTDGSRDIIENRKNAVLEDCAGWEWDKRQTYLNIAQACNVDVLVIVDSDEYFHECSFKIEEELYSKGIDEAWNIPEILSLKALESTLDMRLPVNRPRVLWKPEQMKYYNKHHYQIVNKKTDILFNPRRTIYSLRLYHDPKTLRGWERRDAHDDYIKWLSEYENERIQNESAEEKVIREKAVLFGY